MRNPRGAPSDDGRGPAERVFRAVSEAFGNCLETGTRIHERRFALARRGVWLRSNNEALLKTLYAPFSHLPKCTEAEGPPDLSVEVVSGPSRPAHNSSTMWDGSGAVDRFEVSVDGRFACQEFLASGSLWCMDRVARKIVAWVDSVDRLTSYEKGKPLARQLALWLEGSGLRRIHAGLACWEEQGVLFAGPSGAGKSTSALCCLLGGLHFLGDDWVALEQHSNGSFSGHSVYNSVWLAPDHLARFAGLGERAFAGGETERGKSMLMLADLLPERLRDSAPIRFLMLPHVCPHGRTASRAAKKSEALRRLVPDCLMTATQTGRDTFETLVRLVNRSDCYRLDLGDDLEAVPREVKAVVERD